MPLLPIQADAIKRVGIQAPYGKGSETIVDRTVRDSIQVDGSKVRFLNPAWRTEIRRLVHKICEFLGINGENVRAELYKVLLYEAGGHFKPHTDTEKADGMFGTLVVQFPSRFTGGSFVVRHQGMTKEFHMGSDDQSSRFVCHYVAHYADCEHEIKEITSGLRLAAVYSLSWTKPTGLPSPPSSAPVQLLLRNLPLVGDVCLGVLLQHQYSRASLSKLGLRALKGVDRSFAGTLLAASTALAEQTPPDELVLHVAKAIRTEDTKDGYQAGPAVYLRHVFRADGTPRDRRAIDLLNTFDMREHVLNENFVEKRRPRAGEEEEREESEDLEEGEGEADYYWQDPKVGMWRWIRHASGYTGNQVHAASESDSLQRCLSAHAPVSDVQA